MKKECLNSKVENKKNKDNLLGPYTGSLGAYISISQKNTPYENEFLTIGIGYSIRATSYYVMRADYFPPKKSLFKKAKEKLTEKLKNVDLNPLPQPQPVPISIMPRISKKRKGLEDYI